MNLKEYISSGIIESYVLGIATEAERQDFEAMCQQHPEVLQARIHFELLLENKLLLEAVQPPDTIKDKLLLTIANLNTPSTTDEQVLEEAPVRRLNVWKLIAAAALILLACTGFWAYTLYNKYRATQKDIAVMQDSLKTHKDFEIEHELELMQHSSIKMAALLNPAATQCMAHVYWDTTNKETYILVNNLPRPASDKQYQLWSILDGKPVDQGVFDVKDDKNVRIEEIQLLVKMKKTQNVQAFAITLEPKGGSKEPTMSAMYAISKSL